MSKKKTAYVTTSDYAPCCYIIVKDGHSERDEKHTVLIQTDWDYPGLASRMGWTPCTCDSAGSTDGTVDCACGRTASEMIQSAAEWIDSHLDECFESLYDYFE